MTTAAIDAAMSAMDEDGSGEVSFEEFAAWWSARGQAVAAAASQQQQQQQQEEADQEQQRTEDAAAAAAALDVEKVDEAQLEASLRTIFEAYDDDGSGEIEASELREILASLGHSVSTAEAATIVAHMDQDGSGTVDFEEFMYVCTFSHLI